MKKGLMVGGISIVMAIAVIIAVVSVTADERELKKQLDLAYKYQQELNYENAIVAFDKVISIDDKRTEAYIGKAEIYADMGELKHALEIIEQAISVLEKNEDKSGVAKLLELNESLGGNAYFMTNNVHGIWMTMGEIHEYKSCGYKDGGVDKSVSVNGYIRPLSYEIIDSYDGIQADEGYEWRVFESMFFLPCSEAKKGKLFGSFITDFYNADVVEASKQRQDDGTSQFVVTYKGEDYICKEAVTSVKWHYMIENSIADIRKAVMVPQGYDGIVVGFYNYGKDYPTGVKPWDAEDDEMLMFRLQNDNIGKYSVTPSYIDLNLDEIRLSSTGKEEYWTLFAKLDCYADYDNNEYVNDECTASGKEHWFSNDKMVEIDSKSRIANPVISNGVAMFFVDRQFARNSTNSNWGTGGYSGLVFDFNLGLVYPGEMYISPYFKGKGWGVDNEYYLGDAYPIIYEDDGGIDLAKNYPWNRY